MTVDELQKQRKIKALLRRRARLVHEIELLTDYIESGQRLIASVKAALAQPRHQSPYMTIEEAAAYCGLSVKTLYNRRGELERMPGAGRKLLFKRETLDRWLDKRPRRR